MPASETISSHLSATSAFELYPLGFRYKTLNLRELNPNTLRGAFGAALKRLDEVAYQRLFAPRRIGALPNGFSDPPRPFVFRLNGPQAIGLNLFMTKEPVVDVFTCAMVELGEIEELSGTEPIQIHLGPTGQSVSRIRVRFLTPTELKGTEKPHFGVLMRRIRDRISGLRALYGTGPLQMDFKAFGERADRVEMAHCDLHQIEAERVSRNTGQRHSLGGFVGVAEYEGELAEFVPFLEAAQWTGVGRQTVWGKGEIAIEEI
jgi:hypothetical protein